jgi:hypothetical protein
MSTSFVGLYYPYINFRDEGWLKTAALYCDGITRIVPYSIEGLDSDVVRAPEDGADSWATRLALRTQTIRRTRC